MPVQDGHLRPPVSVGQPPSPAAVVAQVVSPVAFLVSVVEAAFQAEAALVEAAADAVDGPSQETSQMSETAKETFIGEGITPEGMSFSVLPMAAGKPGLPQKFRWRGKSFSVLEVLEEWKEAGDCHHGSGERYLRKHWFRVRTTDDLEMKTYFERQKRSSGGSRWRLYSIVDANVVSAAASPTRT
ncbi:MAG: DUF6504 family protein [Verrucomicrobiia bacterium]